MQPIKLSDLRGPKLYEGFRDDFRKKIIELKRPRRITVGDRVTLVFENRHTLLFQLEEILRRRGHMNIYTNGMRLVKEGQTTLGELCRACGVSEDGSE